MPNTVLQDKQGPDWPLGFIAVSSPGTPVRITSLVDPAGTNAPETATAATAAEYTPRCQQLIFSAVRAGQTHGLAASTGNVYVIRYGAAGAGSGNRDDTGVIVACIPAGQTLFLASSPLVKDVWSPYRYAVDADNTGDGALVTALIF